VLDADTIINIGRHFPKAVRQLGKLLDRGTAKIPEGVYRELKRKSDDIGRRVTTWRETYSESFVEFTRDFVRSELARIERTYGPDFLVGTTRYPGFWASRAGQKAAEGQVVAAAKVWGYAGVTDDRTVKMACFCEGVAHVGWAEFLRQVGFDAQLQLFKVPKSVST
jgi:hypothetical protein